MLEETTDLEVDKPVAGMMGKGDKRDSWHDTSEDCQYSLVSCRLYNKAVQVRVTKSRLRHSTLY